MKRLCHFHPNPLCPEIGKDETLLTLIVISMINLQDHDIGEPIVDEQYDMIPYQGQTRASHRATPGLAHLLAS